MRYVSTNYSLFSISLPFGQYVCQVAAKFKTGEYIRLSCRDDKISVDSRKGMELGNKYIFD
jgi:hypothetical protein